MTGGVTSNARAQTFQAPTFCGNADESIEHWIIDLLEYAKYVNWSEGHLLASLPMLLKGRAKQVYQDTSPTDKVTWNAAVSKLQQAFGTDASANMLRFQQLERIQGQFESVRDYAVDLMKRMRLAKITDDKHMMSYFYRGLLPNIRRELMIMKPETLRDMERYANIIELNNKANGDSTAEAVQSAVSQVSSALTNEVTKLNDKLANNNNDRSRTFTNTGQMREDDRYTTRQGNTDRSFQPRQVRFSASPPNVREFIPRNYNRQPAQRYFAQTNYSRSRDANHLTTNPEGDRRPFCRRCNERHLFGQHVPNRIDRERNVGFIRNGYF